MNLSPVFRQRFFDSNGAPLVGGLLYSYAAGTTTPQATYSNAAGTTNTNPVVLDASGYADVWLDPTLAYKFVLEDASSNVLWTIDNVTYAVGITSWNANSVYVQGAIVVDSSGQGLLYVSLTSGNVGNALTNTSFWRMFSGNVRSVSSSTTLSVTDDLVRSNSTSGSLTHTLPACSTTPIGKKITIKDVGSGGNTTSLKGSGTDTVDGSVTYATTLAQYTGLTVENNGSSWDVLALADARKAPTMSIATASSHTGGFSAVSSGTYTPPTSPAPRYIRVRMVGGGGGGSGSGVAAGGAGNNGANSTFGSVLTAGFGSGGGFNSSGGAGGSGTVGSGAVGAVIAGAGGGGSGYVGSNGALCGGLGGGTMLGGGPVGTGYASNGAAGTTDTGAGGGGGAAQFFSGNITIGSGGGGGGGIDAIIARTSSAWASSFSFAVGSGGLGGGLGTGTGATAGGNGASGIIIVEEYY